MTRAPRSSALALALVVGVSLAACGGSDGDGGADDLNADDLALAAAITSGLEASDADGTFAEVMDTECMGVESVKALGGAAAAEEKYGIDAATVDADFTLAGLQPDDARAVIDGYQRCGDLDDLLVVSFVENGATDEEARCVVDNLPENAVVDSFVAAASVDIGDNEAGRAMDEMLQAAAVGCVEE